MRRGAPLPLLSYTSEAAGLRCSDDGQLFAALDLGVAVAPVAHLSSSSSSSSQQQQLPFDYVAAAGQPQGNSSTFRESTVSLALRATLTASAPRRYRCAAPSPHGCASSPPGACLVAVCGGPRVRTTVHAPPLHGAGVAAAWRPVADVTERAFEQLWAPAWELADRRVRPVAHKAAGGGGGGGGTPHHVVCTEDDSLVAALAQGTDALLAAGRAQQPSQREQPTTQLAAGLATGTLAHRVACAVPRCAAWSPLLLCCCASGNGNGGCVLLATGAPSAVVVLRLCPERTRTSSAGEHDFAVVASLMQPAELGSVTALAFAPTTAADNDGERAMLAIGSSAGSVVLVRFKNVASAADGVMLEHELAATVSEPGVSCCVTAMQWIRGDDGLMLAFSQGCRFCLWDSRSGSLITKDAHCETITGVAYSRMTRTFLTSSTDGTVRFWRLVGQAFEESNVLRTPNDLPVMAVCCSGSGASFWFTSCLRDSTLTAGVRTWLHTIPLVQSDASAQAICDAICDPVIGEPRASIGVTQDWLCGAVDVSKMLATKKDAANVVFQTTTDILAARCSQDLGSVVPSEEEVGLLQLVFFLLSPFREMHGGCKERARVVAKALEVAHSVAFLRAAAAKLTRADGLSPAERASLLLHADHVLSITPKEAQWAYTLLGCKAPAVAASASTPAREQCPVCAGGGVAIVATDDQVMHCNATTQHHFRRCAITRLAVVPSPGRVCVLRCQTCGNVLLAPLEAGRFLWWTLPRWSRCPLCCGPFLSVFHSLV